jgi:hypothetical protein
MVTMVYVWPITMDVAGSGALVYTVYRPRYLEFWFSSKVVASRTPVPAGTAPAAVPVPVPGPVAVKEASTAAPVPAPTPVAVNETPTEFVFAPINVKSVVPTVVMKYVWPTTKEPAVTKVAPISVKSVVPSEVMLHAVAGAKAVAKVGNPYVSYGNRRPAPSIHSRPWKDCVTSPWMASSTSVDGMFGVALGEMRLMSYERMKSGPTL